MEIPSSFLIKLICLIYSGFLTLAIVCLAPNVFAIKQDKILFSSDAVVAIRRSAFLTPASSRSRLIVAPPTKP